MASFVALASVSCNGNPQTDPSPGPTASPPAASPSPSPEPIEPTLHEFDVPPGARPHDVAPAADGGVWYTAQGSGHLGHLDPSTGQTRQVALGAGSRPHGVVVGPDGAPWITDGGLNAIVRVDPTTDAVRLFRVPGSNANLNTPTFDGEGILWYTGQNGAYGSVDPASGEVSRFAAPGGRGPYGIATAPDGTPWYSSLAGSYIARIDTSDGTVETFDVPTENGGARRIWSDSAGLLYVTEWFAGKLARFDPATEQWEEWDLPGSSPQPYAVFVDEQDVVWVSDFGGDAFQRFDPATGSFGTFPLPSSGGNVRQILGRPGEVWGAESAVDKLIVARTR